MRITISPERHPGVTTGLTSRSGLDATSTGCRGLVLNLMIWLIGAALELEPFVFTNGDPPWYGDRACQRLADRLGGPACRLACCPAGLDAGRHCSSAGAFARAIA